MKIHIRKDEKGQMLLIVILVMVIALTVGLSLVSRSITDLKTTTDESDSQKAFSAAEAGIEKTLNNPTPILIAQDLGNNAKIQSVTINDINGSQIILNNGNPVPKDDGVDLWLSTYNTNIAQAYQNPWSGKLYIYWGTKNGCSDAALEVIVLSGTRLSPTVAKYAVDPCLARANVNNFSSIAGGGTTFSNKTFSFGTSIIINGGLLVHIIPLYAGTPLGFAGDDGSGNARSLPSQGKIYNSLGSAGSTQLEINYFQLYN